MGELINWTGESLDEWVQSEAAEEGLLLISDGTINRNRRMYDVAGWRLDNYRRNPVLFYGHDESAMPLGLMDDVSVRRDALVGRPVFAETERGREAKALYEGKMLRGVSTRALPIKYAFERDGQGDYYIHFYEQELLHVSFVGVPANTNALPLESLWAQGAGAGEVLAMIQELFKED